MFGIKTIVNDSLEIYSSSPNSINAMSFFFSGWCVAYLSIKDITNENEFRDYMKIVNKAKTVDVVWLNSRRMLDSVFEVEHSTNMRNSLVKYVELQDFRTDMVIVADDAYRNRFEDTIALSAFSSIEEYVRFLSYNELSQLHSKLFELKVLENRIYKGGRN